MPMGARHPRRRPDLSDVAAFALPQLRAISAPCFTVIRYLSAAYLLFIAWKFWTAKPGNEQVGPRAKEHGRKRCSPACR